MDNGMDNLLDTYLFETNSLLEQMDEILIHAEQAGDFTSDDVNEIFRSMHTIKGSSAMLEFNSIMTVAHHIEDLFYYIRENGTDDLNSSQKADLFNLMFKSTDMIRSEVSKVENNEPLMDNIDNIIEEINAFLAKISGMASAEESVSINSSQPQTAGLAAPPVNRSVSVHLWTIHIFFDEGCGMENLRAFMLVNTLREQGISFDCYPSDVETNSDTASAIAQDGFCIFCDDKDSADKAVQAVRQSNNIRSYELTEPPASIPVSVPAVSAPAEDKVLPVHTATPKTESQRSSSSSNTSKQSLISVNLSKLDSLMALVGEIVITESMVVSSPDLRNLKLDNFLKSARQLRKLTDDLQDIAMSLRMVPVSGVFQKMNRIVRDMSKDLQKNVRLTIVGETTEVDKSIVDNISDPIMHIVRNSMDHGIENTEEERIASGKPAQAEIILSARHTGSEVIISVTDDGQGMDPEAILAKARRQGLLSKPEEEYSQKEILSLLMLPGFSTNTEVTEYSGRGVGLDVVKKNVEALGGSVLITSEKGKGSSTTMKLPLTLSIVDGMELSVGSSIFTIPIANIRQSFKASNEDIIYDTENHELIRCLDSFYPIVRIHELYGIEANAKKIEDGILMWVEASDLSFCLFIDELLGEQQVVVKPIPSYLNQFNIKDSGISGCTILGDGNISIILDVANIYQAFRHRF